MSAECFLCFIFFPSVLPAVRRRHLDHKVKEIRRNIDMETKPMLPKRMRREWRKVRRKWTLGLAMLCCAWEVWERGSLEQDLNVITVFISLDRHHPHRAKPGALATSEVDGGGGSGSGGEEEGTALEENDRCSVPLPYYYSSCNYSVCCYFNTCCFLLTVKSP